VEQSTSEIAKSARMERFEARPAPDTGTSFQSFALARVATSAGAGASRRRASEVPARRAREVPARRAREAAGAKAGLARVLQ
jgi:hypothetical protein